MNPDALDCIAALAPGKAVRVVIQDKVYVLPEVPSVTMEAPVMPPPNPLATIEETVIAVARALVDVREGQDAIVKELRKPVVPKYDGRGKIIAAQREE